VKLNIVPGKQTHMLSQQNSAMLGVIFDLDGVLVQTEHYHLQSWDIVAQELNFQLDQTFYDTHLRGIGRDDALNIILEAANRTLLREDRERVLGAKNDCFRQLIDHTPLPPAPGADELICSLRQEGMLLAVASSSRNARPLLRSANLLSRMDVVVDGNDGPGKPSPALFLKAAALLRVSPTNCIVIEDAEDGLQSATRAGMAAVAVGPPERFRSRVPTVTSLSAVSIPWLADCYRRHEEHLRR
jgi:beta-phosphoglucomutase